MISILFYFLVAALVIVIGAALLISSYLNALGKALFGRGYLPLPKANQKATNKVEEG